MTACSTLLFELLLLFALFYPGQVLKEEPQPLVYKIVTPLVVIGSCIVGLLLVLLLRQRRNKQRQREYQHENHRFKKSVRHRKEDLKILLFVKSGL